VYNQAMSNLTGEHADVFSYTYDTLSATDWDEHLGFNSSELGVDVGHGLVDGEYVGLLGAMAHALIRHEIGADAA
jgi:hypothetical protein